MKSDNAGFSLVELIASISILAIASVAILGFMVVATRHYGKENDEVDVQYEAQLTTNQFTDLLIDAQKGVTYSYNGLYSPILSDADAPAGVTSKSLIVYNDGVYDVLTWVSADQKIYLTEYQYNGTDWEIKENNALMAEYVANMSIDLNHTATKGLVRIQLDFKKDREYEVTQNVTIRNAVKVNEPIEAVYNP